MLFPDSGENGGVWVFCCYPLRCCTGKTPFFVLNLMSGNSVILRLVYKYMITIQGQTAISSWILPQDAGLDCLISVSCKSEHILSPASFRVSIAKPLSGFEYSRTLDITAVGSFVILKSWQAMNHIYITISSFDETDTENGGRIFLFCPHFHQTLSIGYVCFAQAVRFIAYETESTKIKTQQVPVRDRRWAFVVFLCYTDQKNIKIKEMWRSIDTVIFVDRMSQSTKQIQGH